MPVWIVLSPRIQSGETVILHNRLEACPPKR